MSQIKTTLDQPNAEDVPFWPSTTVPKSNVQEAIQYVMDNAGGSQNTFSTVAVSGQSDVVADSAIDILTLVAGSNITITTDAATDKITINSTASGSGDVSAAATIADNAVVRGDGGAKGVQSSGVTLSDTNDMIGVAALSTTTIELGHASDTTISRVSAGTIAIEGVNILTAATGAAISGTPADNQLAVWVGAAAIEGSSQFTFDGATAIAQIVSTDAGAAAGPDLILYRDSSSPADADVLGRIKFDGEDSAGNQQTYATIRGAIVDEASTSEDGELQFHVVVAGTDTQVVAMHSGGIKFADAKGIYDENGNEQLIVQTTASAVNYLEITNAATAAMPRIQAVGDDTNVGIEIRSKGTGTVRIGTGNSNASIDFTTSNTIVVDQATFVLQPGGATAAPLEFQSSAGTLLTTAKAGAMEYDGDCLYGTVDADNRGVIPCINYVRLDANRNLTNSTTEQPIFDSANDALTLETGTYVFQGFISLSSMSATTGNCSFDVLGAGTATLGTVAYQSWGNDAAANATGAAVGGAQMTQAQTGASAVTAATATAVGIGVQGSFEVTAAGSIAPAIALVTAAAAVANAGSYFAVYRIGSTTAVSVGQWN